MRVVKEYNERRNEILDVSQNLFAEKGYAKCTVNDILNAVGIAKGTFYYYFKSKEEVLDAIIERVTLMVTERAALIAADQKLSSQEKLLAIFLAMGVKGEVGEELTEELHQSENALMHQKSLKAMIEGVTPILTEVIEKGMADGVFRSAFPVQYMQIFLLSATTFLDEGVFQVSEEGQQEMLRALISLLEKMLGVIDGELWETANKHWGTGSEVED